MAKIKTIENSNISEDSEKLKNSKPKNTLRMIPLYEIHKNAKLNLRLGIRIMVDFDNKDGDIIWK